MTAHATTQCGVVVGWVMCFGLVCLAQTRMIPLLMTFTILGLFTFCKSE